MRAEKELSLSTEGAFAATRLGRQVLKEAAGLTILSSGANVFGVLVPLVLGSVLQRPPWLPALCGIVLLGILGPFLRVLWDISSGIPMVETELGRVLQQTALRHPPDTHLIQALRSAAIHCREVTAIVGWLCPAPARSSGGLATVERRATVSGVVHGSAVL